MRAHYFIMVAVFLISVSACSQMQVGYLSAKAISATNAGNFAKAEELYLKIMELEPNVADHHWQLAGVYIASRQKAKAQKEIQALRRLGRDDLADQLFIIMNKPDE